MSIKINKINDDQYFVNEKLIYRDCEGQWICLSELTAKEKETFNNHLITEQISENQKKIEAETDKNVALIVDFMEHYERETSQKIPEAVFLSFFNA